MRVLRLPRDQGVALARAVGEHTAGNPYDTVELLNALRRDNALRPGPSGWEWDARTLRRYVGSNGVLDLLSARISQLPPQGRLLLQAMACLGGQVPRDLLGAAVGLGAAGLNEHLAAPLEEGLLVIAEPGAEGTLRMRHDRVQQAAYEGLAPAQRRALHIALARRLAAAPEFSTAAVQQYLPAVDDIDDPQENRSVTRLLHEAAIRSRGAANHAGTQRVLAAAVSLASRLPMPTPQDRALLAALEVEQHVALCSLGRFEEADALYLEIEARNAPVEDSMDALCAQFDGLNSRSRPREALMLGLSLLRQLGLLVPQDFEAADLESRLKQFGRWSQHL